tara:strand:- start:1510 stop:2004 length:495 start_codon:yes stop_codon:yes gene_type:complete
MIKKWIKKIVMNVIEEQRENLIDDTIQAADSMIPSASDVASEIDMYELVDKLDACDIAYYVETYSVAEEMDKEDIASYIDVDYEYLEKQIDYDEVGGNLDYSVITDELDKEELKAWVLESIPDTNNLVKVNKRIDALIELVRGSAQHTLDLMVFNKQLEGTEEE